MLNTKASIQILFINLPGNLSTTENRDSGDTATLTPRRILDHWTTIYSFKGKHRSEYMTREGLSRAAALSLLDWPRAG